MLIAGLKERYSCDSSAAIASQWQRFAPHLKAGQTTYGVKYNPDDEGTFDYLCGIETSDPPADWTTVRIPEQKYAVFTHKAHISTVGHTHSTIWSQWLPESDLKVTQAPDFEKDGPEFNGQTGEGGLEIWIPVDM